MGASPAAASPRDDGIQPASTSLGRPPARHAGAVAARRTRVAPPPCFLAPRASPSTAGARSRGRARARSTAVRIAPPCPARRRRSRRRRARRAPASGRGSPRAVDAECVYPGRVLAGQEPARRDVLCDPSRPPGAREVALRDGALRAVEALSRRLEVDPGVVGKRQADVAAAFERDDLPQLRDSGLSRSDPPVSRQSAPSSSSRVTGRCRFAAR